MKTWVRFVIAAALSFFGVAVWLASPSTPNPSHNPDVLVSPAAFDVALGKTIYAEHCASCHGTNLEGQPDWQSANEDGTYPAPPHDESGHTWHHGDAMLHDYVKRGGQAVLDDMGVNFTSSMPSFSDTLTDEEIEAVLGFIKSTWPERMRVIQEERAQLESTDP